VEGGEEARLAAALRAKHAHYEKVARLLRENALQRVTEVGRGKERGLGKYTHTCTHTHTHTHTNTHTHTHTHARAHTGQRSHLGTLLEHELAIKKLHDLRHESLFLSLCRL
jgi:hypothetical protein